MGYGTYLYGIFPAPGPHGLQLQGLDNQPVQSQIVDGFVFLYSEAQQERYLASRRNLLGHEKVLESAMEKGFRTLLPLQFGSIVQDWDSVAEQLTIPYGESLKSLFAKLEGHREVGVKVFWDENAELQQMLEENETLKAERDRMEGQALSMDQVIAIGQLIERSLLKRKEGIIEQFQAALNALSVEWVENDPLTDTMIYNAAYLILWDTEEKFGDRVLALDRQFKGSLRIRYNNFTAPFNFAQLKQLSANG